MKLKLFQTNYHILYIFWMHSRASGNGVAHQMPYSAYGA